MIASSPKEDVRITPYNPYITNKPFPEYIREIKPYLQFSHCRLRIECFSELIADKILKAMVQMNLEDPVLEESKVYSWDLNREIPLYTLKSWYPLTKDYEVLLAELRELIFKNE